MENVYLPPYTLPAVTPLPPDEIYFLALVIIQKISSGGNGVAEGRVYFVSSLTVI
jgi:hypothetical protein